MELSINWDWAQLYPEESWHPEQPWISALLLLVLFLMSFFGNGMLPMPITAYVIWLGTFIHPALIVGVGTLGITTGWLLLGSKLARAVPQRAMAKMRRSIPGWFNRLFLRRPGVAIFCLNALPFPWDPLRLIAVLQGVPPQNLALPLALGRAVRYTFLAVMGSVIASQLSAHKWVLWAAMALLLLPVMLKMLQRSEPSTETGSSDDTASPPQATYP